MSDAVFNIDVYKRQGQHSTPFVCIITYQINHDLYNVSLLIPLKLKKIREN